MTTRPSLLRPLRIFFDGGCRPNPGRIEVAVVARGVTHFFDDLGEGSSGAAEWAALGCALRVARGLGAECFDLVGDSRAVIRQASGALPCRSADAKAARAQFQAAVGDGPAPRRLVWVARGQNLAGIALDRRWAGVRSEAPHCHASA